MVRVAPISVFVRHLYRLHRDSIGAARVEKGSFEGVPEHLLMRSEVRLTPTLKLSLFFAQGFMQQEGCAAA